MQLQRIVIATDFSGPATDAAEWVARHFAPDAELTLVHVLDPGDTRRPSADPALTGITLEGEWDRASRRLQELAVAFGASRCTVDVRIGRAADEIVRASQACRADMVVVGKHARRSGLLGILGSTAEALVHRSPVPVLLVVAPVHAAPRRLLVAVNDSHVTPWVVQWAQLLAERFDAEATAIHVVGAAVFTSVLAEGAVGEEPRAKVPEETISENSRGADDWLARLCGHDALRHPLSAEVVFGDPAEEIVRAAERMQADMVVMGSRGMGKLGSAILGSVAGGVLRHAPCPVLVVKEPVDEVVHVVG
ncbi:MAG TPA: universal stress protein [Gemmatimonadaceae bacterium]|nr:universal stress protein [Gemmatimonadaceae bacterium]